MSSIIARWFPPILWAALIFLFSADANPYRALPDAWPEAWYELTGRLFHALEYALLAILIARALAWRVSVRSSHLWAAFSLGAMYALSDEVHQMFVPSRSFQLGDLTYNFVGILLGLGLFKYFRGRHKRV
jgi:VanZ family protein